MGSCSYRCNLIRTIPLHQVCTNILRVYIIIYIQHIRTYLVGNELKLLHSGSIISINNNLLILNELLQVSLQFREQNLKIIRSIPIDTCMNYYVTSKLNFDRKEQAFRLYARSSNPLFVSSLSYPIFKFNSFITIL